jgi:hypothetical protein
MNDAVHSIVSIFLAIVGVAIVAVLVSKNAQTPAVIQSVASGFGNDLNVAISPVSGSGFGVQSNLNYPS